MIVRLYCMISLGVLLAIAAGVSIGAAAEHLPVQMTPTPSIAAMEGEPTLAGTPPPRGIRDTVPVCASPIVMTIGFRVAYILSHRRG